MIGSERPLATAFQRLLVRRILMATRRSNDTRRREASPPVGSGETDSTTPGTASTERPSRRRASVRSKEEPSATVRVTVSAEIRRGMIAEAAYLRAERRGFVAGSDVEDWLAAEEEIDALLSAARQSTPQ
jgi:hypothetical protein